MGKNLCSAIGKHQRQFVREPISIMEDLCAILFLFFPVIGELHRAPMGNVAVFTFAEYPVEHTGRAQQSNMSAMERCEWPTSDITLSGKKDSARLTIGGGIKQQILNFIQWNPCVGEYHGSRRWDLIRDCWAVDQISQVRFPGHHL